MSDEHSAAYETAEAAFLGGLKASKERQDLARLAAAVADSASALVAAAYPEFFRLREEKGETDRIVIEAEVQAEKAELLSELWRDIAAAFETHNDASPPPSTQ